MQPRERPSNDGLPLFFLLACGLTWLLAAPLALAWSRGAEPPPLAILAGGLSAFGPLVAALVVGARRRCLREVVGRWRTNPVWILVGLLAPAATHLAATALSVVLGDAPTIWLHPPAAPEAIAALVVFPLGEEIGWRGFAYPRMVARLGLVKGALALGALWGGWHVMYAFVPGGGGFDLETLAIALAELPLYSLVLAWIFERGKRSLAVALAFHAGAHLDHLEPALRGDARLLVAHLVVLAVAAGMAGRALARGRG